MAFPYWALARTLWLAPLVVFFVVLAGCDRLEPAATPAFKGFDVTGASYAQDFRLTDFNGQERTLADFKGRAVLVYFGFIQCPDVCPTALTRAVDVKRLLGPAGDRLQVIFITVDPERDTPEVLKAYMAAFDPTFLALRGDDQRTQETAGNFKAFYKKVLTGSSYTMDHSSTSYVFDPAGKLRLVLRHDQTAQDYAHDIALLLKTP